mmetsp:Transcript_3789/g.14392  ORF Transcript_3789/g.14392 Transcript_3789/m.14392 type:complete len:86 (+) Transcript_3789:1170-1427(+)
MNLILFAGKKIQRFNSTSHSSSLLNHVQKGTFNFSSSDSGENIWGQVCYYHDRWPHRFDNTRIRKFEEECNTDSRRNQGSYLHQS